MSQILTALSPIETGSKTESSELFGDSICRLRPFPRSLKKQN